MNEWMTIFWGDKTSALFDLWSIEHVLSGISVGYVVRWHHRRTFDRLLGRAHAIESWRINLAGVLCLGFAWECIEHYLETGLAGAAVEYWFHGVEMWANRLIADPLLLVAGYAIAKRYPIAVLPGKIASCAWLLLHLFLPHSMYLQELL